MARLRTTGFELNTLTDTRTLREEPERNNITPDIVTSAVRAPRSGTYVGRVQAISGAGFWSLDIGALTSGRSYFWRGWFDYPGPAPISGHRIFDWGNLEISITTAGLLALRDNGVVIGGAGPAVPMDGEYHKLEVRALTANGTQWSEIEVRLDDAVLWNLSGLAITAASNMFFGFVDSPGASLRTVYWDDVAINDSTGADQNSWAGDGKVVVLVPEADIAIGNWTGGAGGVTNLFEAVNNKPPAGVAEASDTDTSQVKITGAAPSDFDVQMQSYDDVGIPAGSTIVLVQQMVEMGEHATTGTKGASIGLLSNPTVALDGSASVGSAAVGTWATGWLTRRGAVQYLPTVTLATSPQARVRLTVQAGTGAAVCAIYMTVEYEEPSADTFEPQVISYLG